MNKIWDENEDAITDFSEIWEILGNIFKFIFWIPGKSTTNGLKETYKSISLRSKDAKILNKILKKTKTLDFITKLSKFSPKETRIVQDTPKI